MLRSRHTLPLTIIAIVIGGICVAIALGIDWIPLVASEQGDRVDNLLWFVIWASIVIFTILVGSFGRSLRSRGALAILSTTSIPSVTSPK